MSRFRFGAGIAGCRNHTRHQLHGPNPGRLEKVVNVSNVETRLVIDMRAIVNARMVSLRNLTLLTDAEDMQPEIVHMTEQTNKYQEAARKLELMFSAEESTTPEEKSLLSTAKEQEAVATPAIAKATEFWLGNKPEDATRILIKEIRPAQKKWSDALDQLVTLEERLSGQAGKRRPMRGVLSIARERS